jgi:hypothetical protein
LFHEFSLVSIYHVIEVKLPVSLRVTLFAEPSVNIAPFGDMSYGSGGFGLSQGRVVHDFAIKDIYKDGWL